jgi:GDP-L-fucose synthase
MDTLVTGSSGFLGSVLTRELAARGHRLVAPTSRDCNLTVSDALNDLPKRRYDRIFHLAAWTQAGDFCLRHPGEQWIINQQINTNVLHWWQRQQPQAKLICIGTSCSYDESLPMIEDNYLLGQPTPSLFTYAMTKRMLLTGVRALNQQFGLQYLHVIPSTLYGPSYHEDGRQLHFIYDLIRKVLHGKHQGTPVGLWGDGNQTRELVHVCDFVDALLALDDSRVSESFNVGCEDEHSIRDFASLICELAGFDFERIDFDTSRYVGARSKCLRVGKLREALPGQHFRPLREGLAETIHWFEHRLELQQPNL